MNKKRKTMKNEVFLGQHASTWLQGDDPKMNLLNKTLKDKEVIYVDGKNELNTIKRFLPKNVTIVKNKSDIDKIMKNDGK